MKTVLVLLLLMFTMLVVPDQAQSPGPDKDKDLGQRKASRHSGLPVVGEFQRQPESDEKLRETREKQYENYSTRLFTPYDDPGALADGGAESTISTIVDYIIPPSSDPPGIPASVTAVVIGTVLSGNSLSAKITPPYIPITR